MQPNSPRITGPTLKVLAQFLERPTGQISGVEISRATGLASGTLYPILFRLEQAGWLESEWENIVPSQAGRPRRRLYRIKALGQANARAAFREVIPAIPELAL
jgi:PadR family transcriptional regulator, regulatory protein PadR